MSVSLLLPGCFADFVESRRQRLGRRVCGGSTRFDRIALQHDQRQVVELRFARRKCIHRLNDPRHHVPRRALTHIYRRRLQPDHPELRVIAAHGFGYAVGVGQQCIAFSCKVTRRSSSRIVSITPSAIPCPEAPRSCRRREAAAADCVRRWHTLFARLRIQTRRTSTSRTDPIGCPRSAFR